MADCTHSEPREPMQQIHDRQRGIHMVVIPNIKPDGVLARVIIVTSMYHCRCCGYPGRHQTLQLCCN